MQWKVCQWVERSQSGRTSAVDKECLGHLATSQMADNTEQVYVLVEER
jgi:hypothetical protein